MSSTEAASSSGVTPAGGGWQKVTPSQLQPGTVVGRKATPLKGAQGGKIDEIKKKAGEISELLKQEILPGRQILHKGALESKIYELSELLKNPQQMNRAELQVIQTALQTAKAAHAKVPNLFTTEFSGIGENLTKLQAKISGALESKTTIGGARLAAESKGPATRGTPQPTPSKSPTIGGARQRPESKTDAAGAPQIGSTSQTKPTGSPQQSRDAEFNKLFDELAPMAQVQQEEELQKLDVATKKAFLEFVDKIDLSKEASGYIQRYDSLYLQIEKSIKKAELR